MVLDEDIDQEQGSVTSRFWQNTFCFVLYEFIPRQVFTSLFHHNSFSCVSCSHTLWLSLGNRCGIAHSVKSCQKLRCLHTYSMVVAEVLDQEQDIDYPHSGNFLTDDEK